MRQPSRLPAFLAPGGALWFPDPRLADSDGLVAVGADLSVERLLHAYEHGLFPWFDDEVPPLWWSPDPRAVIPVNGVHVSRRLDRRVRQSRFEFTWDRAFGDVMRACGTEREEGTWIVREMLDAYARLHEMGHAHSLEVWRGGALVGGIYGVHRGGLFAAESMFHRETDASKAALVVCVHSVAACGVTLFDVQMETPHLASMGARTWPRSRYLETLRTACARPVDLAGIEPRWSAVT